MPTSTPALTARARGERTTVAVTACGAVTPPVTGHLRGRSRNRKSTAKGIAGWSWRARSLANRSCAKNCTNAMRSQRRA